MKLEADLERAFCRYVEKRGCHAHKLHLASKAGFPDRSIILPNGRIAFIEFKRNRNGPYGETPQQRYVRIHYLEKYGHSVLVTDSLEEATEDFEHHLWYAENA